MSQLIEHTPKLHEHRAENGSNWIFMCPACGYCHPFSVGQPGFYKANWGFNGNVKSPTFTPSLRLLGPGDSTRCHLNLTDGKIFYHTDSPHKLAGQTVEMVDI